MNDLTLAEVVQWLQYCPNPGFTPSGSARYVTNTDVVAYVQKMNERVLKLAAALADKL